MGRGRHKKRGQKAKIFNDFDKYLLKKGLSSADVSSEKISSKSSEPGKFVKKGTCAESVQQKIISDHDLDSISSEAVTNQNVLLSSYGRLQNYSSKDSQVQLNPVVVLDSLSEIVECDDYRINILKKSENERMTQSGLMKPNLDEGMKPAQECSLSMCPTASVQNSRPIQPSLRKVMQHHSEKNNISLHLNKTIVSKFKSPVNLRCPKRLNGQSDQKTLGSNHFKSCSSVIKTCNSLRQVRKFPASCTIGNTLAAPYLVESIGISSKATTLKSLVSIEACDAFKDFPNTSTNMPDALLYCQVQKPARSPAVNLLNIRPYLKESLLHCKNGRRISRGAPQKSWSKCSLCSLLFSSTVERQQHYQNSHQLNVSIDDLAIPILDFKNPINNKPIRRFGITSFISLPNTRESDGQMLGFPIVNITDELLNCKNHQLSFPNSRALNFGPIKSVQF